MSTGEVQEKECAPSRKRVAELADAYWAASGNDAKATKQMLEMSFRTKCPTPTCAPYCLINLKALWRERRMSEEDLQDLLAAFEGIAETPRSSEGISDLAVGSVLPTAHDEETGRKSAPLKEDPIRRAKLIALFKEAVRKAMDNADHFQVERTVEEWTGTVGATAVREVFGEIVGHVDLPDVVMAGTMNYARSLLMACAPYRKLTVDRALAKWRNGGATRQDTIGALSFLRQYGNMWHHLQGGSQAKRTSALTLHKRVGNPCDLAANFFKNDNSEWARTNLYLLFSGADTPEEFHKLIAEAEQFRILLAREGPMTKAVAVPAPRPAVHQVDSAKAERAAALAEEPGIVHRIERRDNENPDIRECKEIRNAHKRKGGCFHCGKKGHIASGCYAYAKWVISINKERATQSKLSGN
jgi:hypothetical protein